MDILFPVKKSLGWHFFCSLIKSSKINTKLLQNFRTLYNWNMFKVYNKEGSKFCQFVQI